MTTDEPRFTEEELREVERLQSDPNSEYYYNDPDESFMSKLKRKLEPYGEDFKGFIEYLFTPSRHFGTGQYNEGGMSKQMEMFGYTAKGAQQEADKFVEEAGDIEADTTKAASFLVPFYDSGVNISNVVQEYMKPENERDYDYIKSQFTEAGQSAAIEAGILLMGGVVGKYGSKGIKALADKVKQYEIDPNSVSAFGAGAIRKKPTIKEGVPTIEAAGLTDEAIDAWRKKNATSPEFRKALKGRNPELQELAKGVSEGRVFNSTYRKRVDELRPIRVVKEVPKPATNKEIVSALNDKQRRNPIIGLNEKVSTGEMVDVRLNIPAYTDYDVWVPTIRHNGKEKYKAAVRLKNVNFIKPTLSDGAKRTDSSKALKVAEGGEKNPFAVMTGEYVEGTDDELFAMAKEVFDSDEWTQVGYDPIKRGFFYDRETKQAILEADEVIQVGHLVLAKNAKKADPDVFPFNEGGVAMNEQMEMAFMKQGGIKDDGMKKDPVSGNPIPPGSMASEVRDDIPAMLSEGEYVVPADVLRYYGVNFFENLRGQAKQGLQSMEANGRIGGEPMSPQQVQQNMSGQPMAGAPAVQPIAANAGIMTTQQPDLSSYLQQAQQLGGQPFNAAKYTTVGGTLFEPEKPKSITITKTYINSQNPTDKRVVRFVDGAVQPPSDEQYTQPPYFLQGSTALTDAIAAFEASQNTGGTDPKDPPEPKPKQPFGTDVDWSDPKAYADSLLEGSDGIPGAVQMLGALAGPFGLAAMGGVNAAMTLDKISDLRATQIIAAAQGDTSTSTYIETELQKMIKGSPLIVKTLEQSVAPGKNKALEVLERMGLEYEQDKNGKIKFSEEMLLRNKKKIQFYGDQVKAKKQTPQERAKDLDKDREDDPDIVSSTTEFDPSGTSTTTTIYDPETTAGTLDPGLTTADEDGLNKGGLMSKGKKKK